MKKIIGIASNDPFASIFLGQDGNQSPSKEDKSSEEESHKKDDLFRMNNELSWSPQK